MVVLRSLLFNTAFYINLVAQLILTLPYFFFLPRDKAWVIVKRWARSNAWLHRVIAGTDFRITGLENLPDGPCIIAPKHQSFWDTFTFLPFIRDAVFILKRELTWIPVFGWYIKKMEMIAIDRGSGSKALRQAVAAGIERMKDGRQLIIYPEGTRRPPGAEPVYKYGVVELYSKLNVPVVPIAHVAGLYWPRRKFMRFPGTIHARVLPPIPPGLPKDEFRDRLIRETEAACDELLVEAATSSNPPPLPDTARKRLAELGVKLPDRP